ncbi:MAG TPA: alpha/beta fold hydrolase [Ilumatobacteraceae bacterium]|nr:alpha/beta fold hydrolase [Ilumatobacteraceae bacterium]
MDATDFTLTSEDGERVLVYRWAGTGPPRAIVQIAHGMGEHAARYARLAAALVEHGYMVYANDHRGHGRTAGSPTRHGNLGAAGWDGLVDDLALVAARARAEHPGIPLVLLGHSMGSFAVQQFLLDRSGDIDAAVLSGTTAVDVVAAGIDTTQPADLTAFNAPFAPARTDYDWLSRDDAEVDAYIADPACGFGVDVAGMAGMFGHVAAMTDPARLAGIRGDLPIYVFSGDADPLAGGGELIELVGQRYRDAGVADVTVRLYPGARHETLNETNRDEVTADLVAWLDRVTAGVAA